MGDGSREFAGCRGLTQLAIAAGNPHTFGETWAYEARNLLDQSVGSDKGIIFVGKLLDQLLVLVEFLQIVRGHGINTMVLGSINVMLVS